jgi:hypothetical protein
MMISCISAATSAIPETLRTLHFSMSAARIKNRPMRFMDPVEKLILELREEIKRLKLENRVLKSNLGSVPNSAAVSMKSFTGIHVEDDSNQNLRSSSQSKRVSFCMLQCTMTFQFIALSSYFDVCVCVCVCVCVVVFPRVRILKR